MSKLPRISGAEAVRRLKRLEFTVVRQRGSHVVMRRGSAVASFRIIENSRSAHLLEFFDWLAFQPMSSFPRHNTLGLSLVHRRREKRYWLHVAIDRFTGVRL